MRTQYIGQSRKRGVLTFHTPSGKKHETAVVTFDVGQRFNRSDIVTNPKIDGFRAPSNYYASRYFNNTRDNGKLTVVGTATAFPSEFTNQWGQKYALTGEQELTWQRSTKNETPPFNSTQELRMKILNNLQSEILDVAMVLAELGSTATTGANLMLRIGRSMQAIGRKDMRVFEKLWSGKHPRDSRGRRLSGRSLDRFNRQTADIYLEWKYGIMPTVYDLQGVVNSLDPSVQDSLWNSPPLLVARASNNRVDSYGGSGNVRNAGGHNSPVEFAIEDRVTHKARLDYRVEHDLMRGLNRYGIGLTSLATVAWDKTPFTFVFNMVMPISQIIKAWGAMAGVQPVGYCETWHVNRTIRLKQKVVPNRTQPYSNICKLTSDSEMIMRRSASKSVPMPLPFIRNPVKVGNIATVLSLFTQMRAKG